MKVIFMGTPDFAVDTLEACIAHHDVVAVFTQPDKPKGRGNKLAPPPVKVVAESHNIPVHQPVKIRNGEWPEIIRQYRPDVIVVVAYGQILSQEILDIPLLGCINVHASLLPKYRGAAPINWAIVEGESRTGITTMMMNAGLDTGDMLLKHEVDISDEMDAQTLHDVLKIAGAELLIKTLEQLKADTIKPEKQDDSKSCYAPMLNKSIAGVDWHMTSRDIRNRIRGFNPWPVAHTTLEGQTMKIYIAAIVQPDDVDGGHYSTGHVVKVDKTGIYVKTGDGYLRIDELQLGSGKRMATKAFLLGHEIPVGTRLE